MRASEVAAVYEAAAPSTQLLVDRLLQQDQDDRAWAAQLGPVYRQGDVARLLDKSRQAVSADRKLLRLEMRNGDIGYPVFQFDGRRQVEGIRDVVDLLSPVVATSWTIASWLTSPHPHLGEGTPLERLRDGDIEGVVEAAQEFAHALAS